MLRNYRLQNYNFKLVFNVLVLMAMGLVFIHSANPSFVVNQALGITMVLGIIFVVSLIDFQVFTRNAELLYIFNVVMLIGVKLFGKDVNGAKRWFSLGPLGTFQPSELSKVIMIIVIAAFLAKHQDDLNEPKILGKDISDLNYRYAGLNHFHWHKVFDENGTELTSVLIDHINENNG